MVAVVINVGLAAVFFYPMRVKRASGRAKVGQNQLCMMRWSCSCSRSGR